MGESLALRIAMNVYFPLFLAVFGPFAVIGLLLVLCWLVS